MEEIRKCIYCHETMKYGKNTQVLCKNILKDGTSSYKTIRFIYYGWRCSMKNDYCDIVMDEKDYEKNKSNYNKAKAKIYGCESV